MWETMNPNLPLFVHSNSDFQSFPDCSNLSLRGFRAGTFFGAASVDWVWPMSYSCEETGEGDTMSTLTTQPFDPAAYLDDAESLAAYMSEALATEDPAFIADALGVVARARGMSEIARQSGLSRESLYRALSPDGNPEFNTILRVVRSMGLRLSTTPIKERKIA
jgi:probable addiction module antidote protein